MNPAGFIFTAHLKDHTKAVFDQFGCDTQPMASRRTSLSTTSGSNTVSQDFLTSTYNGATPGGMLKL